jgi:hypothetical protein
MTNEEFAKRSLRHGECLLLPIDELPQDAQEVFKGKQFIVAESETHHHHLAIGDVTVFKNAEGNLFLRVNKRSKIEHKKEFDRHETKTLFPGLYTVVLKREYDYFAKVIREVRD